jgi:hypothetical protein
VITQERASWFEPDFRHQQHDKLLTMGRRYPDTIATAQR